MKSAVYILCGVTALACSILLFRGYRRSKARLLLWCSLFFLTVTLENVILFVDVIIIGPEVTLEMVRKSVALTGLMLLLYGLIWETK